MNELKAKSMKKILDNTSHGRFENKFLVEQEKKYKESCKRIDREKHNINEIEQIMEIFKTKKV